MKKLALAMALSFFFLSSWFSRYTPIELDMSKPDSIEVEIKGAVQNPGVYELPWNSDLETLVLQAGGFTDTADENAVNLSTIIKDRQVVTIREQSDEATQMVSLNTASAEELSTLSGIGPAMAARIIEYREENGFSALEDLMNVKGIGEKTFEKLRDHICL